MGQNSKGLCSLKYSIFIIEKLYDGARVSANTNIYIWAGTPFSGYFFVERKNPAIFGSEAPSDAAACPLRDIKTKYFRRYVKKYSSPQDVSIIRPATTAVSKSFLGYLSPGWCQLSHLSPAISSERPRRLNLEEANYLTPILIS